MNKSKIEWCDYTWNPVTGCLHECSYCYARKIATRFSNWGFGTTGRKVGDGKTVMGGLLHTLDEVYGIEGKREPFPFKFEPTLHRYRLNQPQQVKKKKSIFVCSMADLFGDWVPDEWIEQVFEACERAHWHKYLFLTKNPGRLYELHESGKLPSQHWYGCSVESDRQIFMVQELPGGLFVQKGYKKFASIEPLLEWWGSSEDGKNIRQKMSSAYLENIDWVIVGGQTGPGAVKPKQEWVQNIINQCREAGVPVFLKDNLNWPYKLQEFPEVRV